MWVSELVSESWHEIQVPAGKNKKKKEKKNVSAVSNDPLSFIFIERLW